MEKEEHEIKTSCIETEVFGGWQTTLRNVGGFIAAITTCVIAIFNAYSTHVSVTNNGGWPDATIMFIVNVGPIIIAWTYMRTNKTIETLMQFEGAGDKFRKKVADLISPEQGKRQGMSDNDP